MNSLSSDIAAARAQAMRIASRILIYREDADDAVSEATLRAVRNIHIYDRTKVFEAWFCRIVRNVAIDMLRARKMPVTSLDATFGLGDSAQDMVMQVPDDTYRPDMCLMDKTLSEPLEKALDRMNPSNRLVIQMVDVEGATYAEASEIIGPIGTVRSRLFRGRKHLKEHLQKAGING